MIRRAFGIARQMVPPADMALRCGIRVALASGVLGVASVLPVPLLAKIVHYAGITLVMFSLFAVIGHAEGVFMNHAVGWLKARWSTLRFAIGFPFVLVAAIVVSCVFAALFKDEDLAREDWSDM